MQGEQTTDQQLAEVPLDRLFDEMTMTSPASNTAAENDFTNHRQSLQLEEPGAGYLESTLKLTEMLKWAQEVCIINKQRRKYWKGLQGKCIHSTFSVI